MLVSAVVDGALLWASLPFNMLQPVQHQLARPRCNSVVIRSVVERMELQLHHSRMAGCTA